MRMSLFAEPEIAEIVLDSLAYISKNYELRLFAYVLMHNQMHCILEGDNLSSAVRKFKSYTARRIIDHLTNRNRALILRDLQAHGSITDSSYKVWQEGFHPKQIWDGSIMLQKIEYIHYNPVKAGFVDNPID